MSKQTITQRIHISIAFGDAILPVIECEDGFQRVPLKPIVEQVGAQWAGQRRKVDSNNYINRRLGVSFETLKCSDKPQLCIRMDRVEAFLNSLNPENIRSMGNEDAASWLERKHTEWDDALHHYESKGFASKGSTDKEKYVHLYRLDRINNAEVKRIYAEQINKDYQLDIPIGKQDSLEV